jgi:hypothetical protein
LTSDGSTVFNIQPFLLAAGGGYWLLATEAGATVDVPRGVYWTGVELVNGGGLHEPFGKLTLIAMADDVVCLTIEDEEGRTARAGLHPPVENSGVGAGAC